MTEQGEERQKGQREEEASNDPGETTVETSATVGEVESQEEEVDLKQDLQLSSDDEEGAEEEMQVEGSESGEHGSGGSMEESNSGATVVLAPSNLSPSTRASTKR